jgi:VanZ family protein
MGDLGSRNPLAGEISAGTCLYALSDEVHQIFVPTRNFQVCDLIVDALGALLGLYLFQWLAMLRTHKAVSQSSLL